jgi:hypothetical protein
MPESLRPTVVRLIREHGIYSVLTEILYELQLANPTDSDMPELARNLLHARDTYFYRKDGEENE